MNNERSDWHSDDDLASALERALEVASPEVSPSAPIANPQSAESIDDLFASLVAEDASQSDDQVFESLDEFKPRTNFVPVQAPIDEVVTEVTVDVTETVIAQPASSQVTMPVQWTPHRRSFDEIVFGSSPTN